MVRAIIQYETEPDAERYARTSRSSAARWSAARSVTVAIFGSPFGEPNARYYAEFEWDDMDAFKAAASSEAFAASGRDAMAMGIPFTVNFVSID